MKFASRAQPATSRHLRHRPPGRLQLAHRTTLPPTALTKSSRLTPFPTTKASTDQALSAISRSIPYALHDDADALCTYRTQLAHTVCNVSSVSPTRNTRSKTRAFDREGGCQPCTEESCHVICFRSRGTRPTALVVANIRAVDAPANPPTTCDVVVTRSAPFSTATLVACDRQDRSPRLRNRRTLEACSCGQLRRIARLRVQRVSDEKLACGEVGLRKVWFCNDSFRQSVVCYADDVVAGACTLNCDMERSGQRLGLLWKVRCTEC